MKKTWPMVALGEVMKESRQAHAVDRNRSYPNFGIYSYARGLFSKPPIDGMATSATTLYRARKGQFVYSRLFAFEGAYGVVPPEMDGYFVSNEFPLFDSDEQRLCPAFLHRYISIPRVWRAIAEMSTGVGHRRQRVHPEQLLTFKIPLPPLEEQRRIVGRIEELATKIVEAAKLRSQAITETGLLSSRAFVQMVAWDNTPQVALGDLLREGTLNGLGLRPNDAPPGYPILRISAGTSRPDATVAEDDVKYADVGKAECDKYQLHPEDLLACRFNGNLHYVGRFSLFVGRSKGIRLYPDKLIRFRVDTDRVLPAFVCLMANSPRGRERIESFCATTAGNIGISATELKTVRIPVPTLAEQRRVVNYLGELAAKADALKEVQAQSSAELNALLPSVLDKAFKGEL